MNIAFTQQKFQDWFTQQWVILWGRKINPADHEWLYGPFGQLNGIGEGFVYQLATMENLSVVRYAKSAGLLSPILDLHFSEQESNAISKDVLDFYENTSEYELRFSVKWNVIFKPFAYAVNFLFSKRINQLNIPMHDSLASQEISSEIIKLVDKSTNVVKYTFWLRKIKSTGDIVYSGIYSVCKTPSGKSCVKAIFPLPNGNATVILQPSVGNDGELILTSSGKKFGDAGFYFLLSDSKGVSWSQYIKPFEDQLAVHSEKDGLRAVQVLKLWRIKVVRFEYTITRKRI